MKLWLLCLWFYWPLIKLLPVEAHNEADDWCGWRITAYLSYVGLLVLPPTPIASKQAPPTLGIGWERGMNSVPRRLRPLEKRLCPRFKKILRRVQVQSEPSRAPSGASLAHSPFQLRDLSLSHQRAFLRPKFNYLAWEVSSCKKQEVGAGNLGL